MSESVVFDRAAGSYDETRGFPPGEESRAAALLCAAGRLTRASRVLEIGIGTGRIALPLAPHVRTVVGVDLSRKMMARLIAKRSAEPVYVAEADATRLPFPAGPFDAAVAVHVFHLIPDWTVVLREVARALRPGGVLLHAWNDNSPEHEDLLWKAWDETMGGHHGQHVGVPFERRGTFLADEGWRKVGETHIHSYTSARVPRMFLKRLEERSWSSMWRLSDDDVARGIAAVRAAMDAHGLDLDTPRPFESKFCVEAYQPPAAQ